MKQKFFLCFLLLVCWCIPAFGGEPQVTEGVIAMRIVDRSPIDAGHAFSLSAGKLYCYSVISGAETDTIVTHVWY